MTKATGAIFAVHFRRRRQGRTDFNKRLAQLKSGKTRMIVRKTNRYVIVSFADFDLKGDKAIVSCSSKALVKLGYPGKCNTPSAYLTGLLCGKAAKQKGVSEAVLDIGRHSATKGGVLFAAMKGALDAGIKIPYSEDILPDVGRISGKHIKGDASGKFEDCKGKIMVPNRE
ncbi:MAG: 50S ribosomal protein L18 [Candidatus Micrarchaeota archaeon]